MGTKNEKIILKLILVTLPRHKNSLKASSLLTKEQTKETRHCVDCHSVPCFKVYLFQSNLYSVLGFSTYYILKFRSLLKNICNFSFVIYMYLAELLVFTTCNRPICP